MNDKWKSTKMTIAALLILGLLLLFYCLSPIPELSLSAQGTGEGMAALCAAAL